MWFDEFLHFTSFYSLLSYLVDSHVFTQEKSVFGFYCDILFEFRLQRAALDKENIKFDYAF